MKSILFCCLALLSVSAFATDDPKVLIRELNKKFAVVQDYTAKVQMDFAIPGVKMNHMSGQVYFRKPDRFRMKAKGIFFLPKQNPLQQIGSMLLDTSAYTSIISGYETIAGHHCAIVNIIPTKNNAELILGKCWIDVANPLIWKTQITTRNNGTIETQNQYGNDAKYTLPERMEIRLELKKIKVSRMIAGDINKKSKPKTAGEEPLQTGKISLQFSDYRINSHFPESDLQASQE